MHNAQTLTHTYIYLPLATKNSLYALNKTASHPSSSLISLKTNEPKWKIMTEFSAICFIILTRFIWPNGESIDLWNWCSILAFSGLYTIIIWNVLCSLFSQVAISVRFHLVFWFWPFDFKSIVLHNSLKVFSTQLVGGYFCMNDPLFDLWFWIHRRLFS